MLTSIEIKEQMKERTPTNPGGAWPGLSCANARESTTGRALSHGNSDRMLELKSSLAASLGTAVLLNANASGISYTPAGRSALLAHAGSGLADTVNHYPARATAHTGLRDHAIRLRKRGERHRLRRCCDR